MTATFLKFLLILAIALVGLYSAKVGYRFGKDLASSKSPNIVTNKHQG